MKADDQESPQKHDGGHDNLANEITSNYPGENQKADVISTFNNHTKSNVTAEKENKPLAQVTSSRAVFVKRGSQAESIKILVPQRDIGEEAVVVWDAALVLAYYLEKHQVDLGFDHKSTNPIHVVDIGSGTGAVGLVAAALGASVTLTDLDRCLPLLNEGIRNNLDLFRGQNIRACPLTWGKVDQVQNIVKEAAEVKYGAPDLILVSDCVYYEASVAPLILTLRELARSAGSSGTTILLSYEVRDYSPEKKKGNKAGI